MRDLITAYNIGHEYLQRVRGVYGVWVELCHAMELLCDTYSKWQSDLIRLHAEGTIPPEDFNPNFNVSYPHITDSSIGTIKHSARVEEVIRKNSLGGPNRIYLSGMCVVTMHDLWENYYRRKLEEALGLGENGLQAPVMGEVRRIRNAFLKHRFRGDEKTATNKLIRAFAPDEPIGFSEDDMEQIVQAIREYVTSLAPIVTVPAEHL